MIRKSKRYFPPLINPFPSRCNRTHNVAQALQLTEKITLCGRLLKFQVNSDCCFGVIQDFSGNLVFGLENWTDSISAELIPLLSEGDFVEIEGRMKQDTFQTESLKLIALSKAGAPKNSNILQEIILLRSKVIDAIRQFFKQREFIEIETPYLVPYPNLELNQEPFITSYQPEDKGKSTSLFLPSSPEYYLKRLLSNGFEKIFSIAHSFRNGENTLLHHPEFMILEWYRAYASYEEIMNDLEELIFFINKTVNSSESFIYTDKNIDLSLPWERLTMMEVFKKYTDDKIDLNDNSVLINMMKRIPEFPDGHLINWEDAFLTVFLEQIEPNLGVGKPLLLKDYPAPLAALSKLKNDNKEIAERVECYIEGIEIANGYTELNDSKEQYERFLMDIEKKKENGKYIPPIDKDFLKAIEHGFPPAGGIALGLDRLIMLLSNQPDVSSVIPFPLQNL